MKKNLFILILSTMAFGLTAFGFVKWESIPADAVGTSVNTNVRASIPTMDIIDKRIFTDFIYEVGPRFSPIKKEDFERFTSVYDFLPEELHQRITSLQSVEVVVLKNDRETTTREMGHKDMLTESQLALLRSSDYSTNFKIHTHYQEKIEETATLKNGYASPHLTIVPHIQAEYVHGKDALLGYIPLVLIKTL